MTEPQNKDLERIQSGSSKNDEITITWFAAHGITATPRVDVFKFSAWKALGRQVCKDEHGCRLTVYVDFNGKKESGDEEPSTFGKKRKGVSVFHISQTEPIGTPKSPCRVPVIARPVDDEDKNDVPATADDSADPANQANHTRNFDALIATGHRRIEKAKLEFEKSRVTNTPKRMRVARGILEQAQRDIDRAGAVIWIAINRPSALSNNGLMSFESANSAVADASYKRSSLEDFKLALGDYEQSKTTRPDDKAIRLLAAQQNAIGSGVDFFRTKPDLARKIAYLLPNSMIEVLDLCCGDGALTSAILDARPRADILCLDQSSRLIDVAKIHFEGLPNVHFELCDALQFCPGYTFDAVVVNPPFSNDMEIIRKAWGLLSTGGTMAAICGESVWVSAERTRNAEFLKWLHEIDATVEKCDPNSFDGTSANARLIVAIK
ncbi:MAG: class I SAM-dependent methyltransferase [Shewanella sp.]